MHNVCEGIQLDPFRTRVNTFWNEHKRKGREKQSITGITVSLMCFSKPLTLLASVRSSLELVRDHLHNYDVSRISAFWDPPPHLQQTNSGSRRIILEKSRNDSSTLEVLKQWDGKHKINCGCLHRTILSWQKSSCQLKRLKSRCPKALCLLLGIRVIPRPPPPPMVLVLGIPVRAHTLASMFGGSSPWLSPDSDSAV